MARIWHCCGSGVGQEQQLRLDPLAWEPPCAMGVALKRQKDKKKKLVVSNPDLSPYFG